MTLEEVKTLLHAKVIYGEDKLKNEVKGVFGCDLLSDMLAFAPEGVLLLTGLTNDQLINTADLIGACGIIYVRGKLPPRSAIQRAMEKGIPLLSTDKLLYECCGILYVHGLPGLRVANQAVGS